MSVSTANVSNTTTTLSAAITATQRQITVGSNSTHTVGQYIVVGAEAMLVQSIPTGSTTLVNVERGQLGTRAVAHASSTVVYGSTTSLGPTAYYPRTNEYRVTLPDTPPAGLPNYMLPLGSQRFDESGNEYIFCHFADAVHSGITVLISNDGLYNATVVTTSSKGNVGVVAETDDPTSTSAFGGWVQVFGSCSAQIANNDSAVTSATVAVAASSVTTPATGMATISNGTSTQQSNIYGMFIVNAATTTVTSAASHAGVAVPVWLDYPYVLGIVTDLGTS